MKEKVSYKVGKFTDFTGATREVVLCAISTEVIGLFYDLKNEDSSANDVVKEIRLGIAIQNTMDKANTELGKVIAYGKAKKEKSCFGKILSTSSGMINQKVVDALLEQEYQYFKQNPGKYIASYNKHKQDFLNIQTKESSLASFKEKEIYDVV